MKTVKLVSIILLLTGLMNSCGKEAIEPETSLQKLETTNYFDAEIFTDRDLSIYGTWKLFDISGRKAGSGYDLNFEYFEVKAYGI